LSVAIGVGAFVWVIAGYLTIRGARRFTRDQLASRL
jgi:hypothetical protein